MENQENRNQNRKDLKRPAKKILDDGPKFNYFWIWALFIVFVIIMLNVSYFQDNPKETNMTQLRAMLTNNDVDKNIVVTSNQKSAEIFLKDSALSKPAYKDIARNRFGTANKGPHYTLTVASNDAFDKFITDFYNDNTQLQKVDVKYEISHDWWQDIVPWLLPLLLIAGLWIYMLRRAGGGGIGGGSTSICFLSFFPLVCDE